MLACQAEETIYRDVFCEVENFLGLCWKTKYLLKWLFKVFRNVCSDEFSPLTFSVISTQFKHTLPIGCEKNKNKKKKNNKQQQKKQQIGPGSSLKRMGISWRGAPLSASFNLFSQREATLKKKHLLPKKQIMSFMIRLFFEKGFVAQHYNRAHPHPHTLSIAKW